MKFFSVLIVLITIINSQALSQYCLPNGIIISTQDEVDSFKNNYPGCTEIGGTVTIHGDNITDLSGFNNLAIIHGNLFITESNALTSLEGLDNLIEIIGGLRILDNYSLANLNGLNNLHTIGKYFAVINNYSLTNIEALNNVTQIGGLISIFLNSSLTSLIGLNNITTINEGLEIRQNNFLISLEGLNNITSIFNIIDIHGNNDLISIEAIANIDTEIINSLSIYENASLSRCASKSVCDYLDNVSGYVQIKDNSSGCNSINEVEEACLNWISDKSNAPECLIFPNPAKTEISISINNHSVISECTIFDCLGQKVFYQTYMTNKIDLSELNRGIYIVELTSNEFKIREKLIIKE